MVIALAGNKTDLAEQRDVDPEVSFAILIGRILIR